MTSLRNPVAWFEIYVNDLPRARAFYEAMLGVQLEHLPTPAVDIEMWTFPMSEDCDSQPGAAGALCKMESCPAGEGGTMIYFSCDDCAVEQARAAEAGGRILKSKMSIGQFGFISILADTEGNTIGLHSQK